MVSEKVFGKSRKRLVVVTLALVLLLALTVPAAAVQFGVPDGNDHPQVGLLVFDVNGSPAWRCSGTLLSPTVMLTAGHCTFGASGGRVWFEPDVSAGRPANGYPFGGGTSIEFAEIHTHPDYIDQAFYLFDVGVVILSEPVISGRVRFPGQHRPARPAGYPPRIAGYDLHRSRLRFAERGPHPASRPGPLPGHGFAHLGQRRVWHP
jgi:hypothetical protein